MVKKAFYFLMCASAFPELVIRRRLFPRQPSEESVAWQENESYYHNWKNQGAESLRADPSYYAKLFSFLTVLGVLGWLI